MKTTLHTHSFRVLLLALLTAVAFSASAYDFMVDGLCYDQNSDGTSVTVTCQNSASPTYTDLNGALTIPSSVTHMNMDFTVTAIGDRAFQGCAGITSVTIPGTVATIGDRAFDGTGLTSLTIPASVTWVGAGAFLCPLNSVVWEAQNCNLNYKVETEQDSGYDDVGWPWRYIHKYFLISPFSYYYYYFNENWIIEENVEEHFNNNLTSFTLGKNIETIPANLCRGLVGLTSITIPSSVKEIGTYAFANCIRLKKIYSRIREPQNVNYGDDIFCYFDHGDDEFFIADYQELDFTLYVPHHCASKYNSCLPWSNYTIVEMDPTGDVNDDGTVNVTDYAMTAGYILEQDPQPFYPDEGDLDENGTITVSDLEGVANCALHYEEAPMAADVNGNSASEIDRLYINDITMTAGDTKQVEIMLDNTTAFTALQADIYLPEGLSIEQQNGEYLFNLTERKGSDHTIMSTALSNGAIRICIVSQNLNAFNGQSGALVTFNLVADTSIDGTKVIELRNVTATEQNFTEHTLSNSSCNVGVEALIIPSTGISLNKHSLLLEANGSETLVATITPSNATNSGVNWTSSNASVATVDNNGMVTAVGQGSANIIATTTDGSNLTDTCHVAVLSSSEFIADCIVYQINSDNETLTITYTDKSDTYANNYPGLVTANIPMVVTHDDVTYAVVAIAENAFRNCKTLESVTIPVTVTSIGIRAFGGCEALTSINVKSGNAIYDSRNNCNAIIEKSTNRLIAGCKTTVIPNDVTAIGTFAFYEHHGLETIEIPSSVTLIERSAFNHILGLTTIAVPNSVVTLEPYVFSQCYGLQEVTIGSGVTSIGMGLLYGCSAVTSLTSHIMDPSSVTMGEKVFKNMDYENCVLHVPAGTSELYRNADQWQQFFNIVEEQNVPCDVDGDGVVTASDVTLIYNILLSGDWTNAINADQDGDGIITSADITIIYNVLLGN